MSIKEELIQYANRCLSDTRVSEFEDYISCEKHKWACKRFLRDLKRSESRHVSTEEKFPYIWDEEEAQKIVSAGPRKATIALAKLKAELTGGSTQTPRPSVKVSKAPTPPPQLKGSAVSKGAPDLNTDDLEAFSRALFTKK